MTNLQFQEHLLNPKINVYEIINGRDGSYRVWTYRKPGESDFEFNKRHESNIERANRLKIKTGFTR